MKNPEDQRCAICRFAGEPDGETMPCRAHPPTVTQESARRWPRVLPNDWCGEFVRDPDVPVP